MAWRTADSARRAVKFLISTQVLDIKISNPDAYGFDPKDILSRVGRIACCFAASRSSPGRWPNRGIMMWSCCRDAPRPCVG